MTIRNRAILGTASFFGARAARLWMKTLSFEYQPLGTDVDPNRPELAGRYIYAMWHEYLLLPLYWYARSDICVLISKHADGQLIANFCQHLRIPVVRGSTTRGGVEAIRRMLRAGRDLHLAMTPDGPRGPRRIVQPGVVYLSARLGLPVVPVGFGLHVPWRMASWDAFAVPRPGSRARCVTCEPIAVPHDATKDVLESCRRRLEQSLNRATHVAEQWARTGRWPIAAAA
jgi:lysophospholipid acyltransferase (LPLAT)-like uncharacterized protein